MILVATIGLGILQFGPQAEWRAIAEKGAPVARSDETVVWTGREALIFGGLDRKDRYLTDGAAYDVHKDTWRGVATKGAPSSRAWHTAVWTGREMLLWGGDSKSGEKSDGAAYDPRADRWRPMAAKGAPTARGSHVAVWTGSEMIVWAGVDEEHSFPGGGRYDPVRDAWTPFRLDLEGRLVPRSVPGVWTGRECLVWGGVNGGFVLGHGVGWNPAGDTSRLMEEGGAPAPRARHAAVWTGSELVVWGGSKSIFGGRPLADGGRFDPAKNRWRPLPAASAPPPRFGHAFAWHRGELVVVGGAKKRERDALRDAWAWHPEKGWRRLPDLPAARVDAHAFSTSRGLLVLGGRDATGPRRGGFLLASARPAKPARPAKSAKRRK